MYYVVRAQILQQMGTSFAQTGALDYWNPDCVEHVLNEGILTVVGDSKASQKENKKNGIRHGRKEVPLTALQAEIERVGQSLN